MFSKVILNILFVKPRPKCSLNKGHIANILFKLRNTVVVETRGFKISVFCGITNQEKNHR